MKIPNRTTSYGLIMSATLFSPTYGQTTLLRTTLKSLEVAPTPAPTPAATMPVYCTTVVEDLALSSTYLATEKCATVTQSLCRNICPPGICPAVIRTKTITVPCVTRCCPTTPTVTVRNCTVCEQCPYDETVYRPQSCKYGYNNTPSAYRTTTVGGVTSTSTTTARKKA
ncbi:hypothetical protein V8F20_003435 [Naviculisporaceae sp. PSN 640]